MEFIHWPGREAVFAEPSFSDGTEHGRSLKYYGTPASATDPTGQQLRGNRGVGYTPTQALTHC